MEKASALLKGIPEANAALKNLREILRYISLFGVVNFKVDLGIARGLDYYTDFVFEIYVDGVQVAGGGRYDELVELLGGEPTPAVGVGFGVDRVARALLDRKVPLPGDHLSCLVLPADDEVRDETMKIVAELRGAGLSVDTDLMGRSLSKAMSHANSLKVKRVVVVGKEELRKGQVVLRDMATGNQELVAVGELIKKLKSIA